MQNQTAPFRTIEPWHAGSVLELKRRSKEDIKGIVVHRIEVSQEDSSFGDSPEEVIRFFADHPRWSKATDATMPYPLVIEADGQLTQTLPLELLSYHAVAANPDTIGIALIGDFRTKAPSKAQWQSLVVLCAQLLQSLGADGSSLEESLRGHDEVVGGSRTPDKECPGRELSMTRLREAVSEALAKDDSLSQWPIVWGL